MVSRIFSSPLVVAVKINELWVKHIAQTTANHIARNTFSYSYEKKNVHYCVLSNWYITNITGLPIYRGDLTFKKQIPCTLIFSFTTFNICFLHGGLHFSSPIFDGSSEFSPKPFSKHIFVPLMVYFSPISF